MLNELRIPRMGSVENARLLNWRVQEGEAYEPGQVLYEIETDKTSVEVEAEGPGVLARHLAAVGDEFKVGDRIGLWALPGTAPATLRAALSPQPMRASERAPSPSSTLPAAVSAPGLHALRPVSRDAAGGRRVSPLARRLAAQNGVDLATVTGTGMGGKISGKDVLAASAKPRPAPVPVSPPRPGSDGEIVPHSLRRRTIAQRMVEAAAIPTLTADMEVDLTALFARRRSVEGNGASVLGMIAEAAIAALLQHRRLNAHWREDAMVQFGAVHLGIAVDTPEGLVVPVVRNAESLNARGLTDAIAALADKARAGTLRPQDMEGGTFTISNPGSMGPVVRAEALLNPPQVALLGLPGIVRAPVAIKDGDAWAMAVRPLLRLSLSFDHRALDGGPVIAFLNTLKATLERP
uniref:Dihydrolipoamide acetyltransferase component of pyruvate dehydrogenase complex n=1 Tax=Novosphingobium aromaticivorans TaxID=48935 RepID=Q5EIH5_NOVAR|nr:dihydrolipoamide succinyltransferase component E2 [Novosphingobium aromaticivorans]